MGSELQHTLALSTKSSGTVMEGMMGSMTLMKICLFLSYCAIGAPAMVAFK